MSLELRFAIRAVLMPVVMAAIVFLPAGTWNYWQGWAFLAAFVPPPFLIFLYFMRYDRALVERRMQGQETVPEQRLLMGVFALLFFGGILLTGFDHRLGWSGRWVGDVPVWVTAIALPLVVGAHLFIFWVMKVNSFARRTVRVEEGQKVISTGPYAWVRHPMYLGIVVLTYAVPLALGSWVVLPVFVLLIPLFAMRLLNEEKVLRTELPGYAEYCHKARSHLIPLVW